MPKRAPQPISGAMDTAVGCLVGRDQDGYCFLTSLLTRAELADAMLG